MQRIVYLLHLSIYGIFFYSGVWLSKKFKGDKAYDMWWKDYNYKKRKNFKQEQFAELLNVSRQSVSKWEKQLLLKLEPME